MGRARILVVLFGAIPATGWGVYLLHSGALNPFWTFVCWFAAVAHWIADLTSKRTLSHPWIRGAVVLGLSLGILLALVPVGLNARGWLMYLTRFTLEEHLEILGVLGALLAPIVASAFCLGAMLTDHRQRLKTREADTQ